jgi:HK97 family phage prohead protease
MPKKARSVPQPGEDENEFIDRCVQQMMDDGEAQDTDDAYAACQGIWEQHSVKAGKGKVVVHKIHSEQPRGFEYVLSDETPDRYGDILMVSGWDITNFKKNPIALFGHRSDFPIGLWGNLRVENKQLRGNLQLAPKGTSPRIDELRKLVEAGILKAVSVGFVPINSKPRGKDVNGTIYTKHELIETSLVSIPANPNALQVVKQLNISPDVQRLVFDKRGIVEKPTRLLLEEGYRQGRERLDAKLQRACQALNEACAELDRLRLLERQWLSVFENRKQGLDYERPDLDAIEGARKVSMLINRQKAIVTLARFAVEDAATAVAVINKAMPRKER